MRSQLQLHKKSLYFWGDLKQTKLKRETKYSLQNREVQTLLNILDYESADQRKGQ